MVMKLIKQNVSYFFICLLAILLSCSEKNVPKTQNTEDWSNEAELLFQKAEVLKHTLEESKINDSKPIQ